MSRKANPTGCKLSFSFCKDNKDLKIRVKQTPHINYNCAYYALCQSKKQGYQDLRKSNSFILKLLFVDSLVDMNKVVWFLKEFVLYLKELTPKHKKSVLEFLREVGFKGKSIKDAPVFFDSLKERNDPKLCNWIRLQIKGMYVKFNLPMPVEGFEFAMKEYFPSLGIMVFGNFQQGFADLAYIYGSKRPEEIIVIFHGHLHYNACDTTGEGVMEALHALYNTFENPQMSAMDKYIC